MKKKTTAKKTVRAATKSKKAVAARPKTHVAIILDRSGSMAPIWNETIAGFKQQIRDIQKLFKEQDVRLSFITFNDTPVDVLWDQPVDSVGDFISTSVAPSGNTAMYDAVGMTIAKLNKLESASDPETAFLVVIMSDGQENSSRTYTSHTLAPLITALQNSKRWTFTYVGANQDLTKVTQDLHIPMGNTMSWTTSSIGAGAMGSAQGSLNRQYFASRAGGQSCSTNFYDNNGSTANADELAEKLKNATAAK